MKSFVMILKNGKWRSSFRTNQQDVIRDAEADPDVVAVRLSKRTHWKGSWTEIMGKTIWERIPK